MGHRTQITLTDRQYEMLRRESERSGRSLAELVRRALAIAYRLPDGGEEGLERSFGAWSERDFDGASHVEHLRPGLGRRLEG